MRRGARNAPHADADFQMAKQTAGYPPADRLADAGDITEESIRSATSFLRARYVLNSGCTEGAKAKGGIISMKVQSSSGGEQEGQIQVFYLGEGARRLFTALHLPGSVAQTGLVFCPPLWMEMNSTYHHLARWAKELAQQGIAGLRYHPYGMGDSDGSLADFTLQSARADVEAAARCLRERAGVKRLGIVGVRFGGTVAVLAADAVRPDFLILWSPILDLRQYSQVLLRLRLTKDMVHQQPSGTKTTTQEMLQDLESGRSVDIMGYDLCAEFYRQMNSAQPWPRVPATEVLWLGRPAEQGQVAPILEGWKSQGCKADVRFLREPGFWEDRMAFPRQFAATSYQWLALRRSRSERIQ